MKELLISILDDLYPVFLQGSAPKHLPASFFTIWETSEDGAHYDNEAVTYIWTYDINFYSQNPSLTNTVLIAAKKLLKKNGFIVGGKGRDMSVDNPLYTTRTITAQYIETAYPPEPEPEQEPEPETPEPEEQNS